MTRFPAVLLCSAVVALAGCAGKIQAPASSGYDTTTQHKMQAAHHWDVLAEYEVDRERGYIMAEDRTGELRKHPLVSISLAGILLRQHDFGRYVEVAAVCAELKKEAKSRLGSNLFIDRRKGVTV